MCCSVRVWLYAVRIIVRLSALPDIVQTRPRRQHQREIRLHIGVYDVVETGKRLQQILLVERARVVATDEEFRCRRDVLAIDDAKQVQLGMASETAATIIG